MSATDEFESLADWMGEQDWTVNVRDYTDEYVTYVREQPVELLAERLMQSSWLAEHDAKVRAEELREAYADVQAYTDSGAPFGHRPVEEFLLRRADRIEREAGE